MAGNPQINQGTLNRLRGSVVVPDFSGLNVTAPFLGRAALSLSFGDMATLRIKTMTGIVTSPEPYQECVLTINLLKTQSLANAWETQRKTLSTIGDVTVTPDAATLTSYLLNNCSIDNVRELSFAGEDAGYVITIGGYYQVNNSLWGL